jgi:hypothetical protein
MIEINRANSLYIFRVNMYNDREIDFRRNQHNARWKRLAVYDSAEEARTVLLQLEKGKAHANVPGACHQ